MIKDQADFDEVINRDYKETGPITDAMLEKTFEKFQNRLRGSVRICNGKIATKEYIDARRNALQPEN